MTDRLAGLCRSGKSGSYPDEQTAVEALAAIRAEAERDWNPGRKVPCRVYECGCGEWHLTSQAKPKKGL
ncbi:hypothetical protein Ade02nite_19360 [Paractinoplanes deccanensis]|uniref:Uncharacterized protein n=1 Tax=Paractinoplanes deccanensis TaxID=113561 RepID=A0ABQ3Y011_9ACTN|nr:hypothetical protein [Actinoplanes deccanensis]GID73295.1 hypothetical protein Ade02nite_19360 [Actinoplanes deccanensis]